MITHIVSFLSLKMDTTWEDWAMESAAKIKIYSLT